MKKNIDISSWVRKEQYQFFKDFEEPFWGVTVEVDCTKAYQKAKKIGASFFFYYLHKSLMAVNATDALRYRIEEDRVYLYDRIGAAATVDRADGTFGFSFIDYEKDFELFQKAAQREFAKVRAEKTLTPGSANGNIIHYSSLPWLKFTALSHARSFKRRDSVPKISFGKMTDNQGKKMMPVSIHVHHALVDGLQVGRHVEAFQDFLNQ